MLVGGPRDAPERQRTLEGAIGWSHNLLDEAARVLFRRLSVFAVGWMLHAVMDVADPVGDLDDEARARVDGFRDQTQRSPRPTDQRAGPVWAGCRQERTRIVIHDHLDRNGG